MQIHLSPRNIRLTAAIHSHVGEKIMRLDTDPHEILASHIVLMREESSLSGVVYRVNARLEVPGPDLHATAVEDDLYSAIDRVSDKLLRLLRKRNALLDGHDQKTVLTGVQG